MPEGRFTGVKRHGKMRWLLFFDNVQHRIGDPKHRRGTTVVGRESRTANQGKMRAIDQRHRIEQIQFFFFFGHLASRTDLSTVDEGAKRLETLDLTGKNFVTVHGHCRSILRIESVRRGKMLQLFLCCPRMNLL